MGNRPFSRGYVLSPLTRLLRLTLQHLRIGCQLEDGLAHTLGEFGIVAFLDAFGSNRGTKPDLEFESLCANDVSAYSFTFESGSVGELTIK